MINQWTDAIWNCIAQPVLDGQEYYQLITVNSHGQFHWIAFNEGGEYYAVGEMVIAAIRTIPAIKKMYFTIDMHPRTTSTLVSEQIDKWEKICGEKFPFEVFVQRPSPGYDALHNKDTAFRPKLVERKSEVTNSNN